MKNLLKITAILLVLFSMTSCFFDGVQGNGNVVNKKRKISNDFVRLKVNKGLHVFITRDSKPSLVVEADENLQELITTVVENGTLTISTTKNIGMASAKNVHLSVENLNEILVSSGAEVSTENKLVTEKLRVDASSGAEVKLQLKVRDLTCDTSSGAMVRFQGKAVDLVVTSSSGSNINALELDTNNCDAKASSGSNIKVNVSNDFKGKASSGAHIKYSGNPKIVKRNKSSGGSISGS